jgi:hypothetical protein
MESNPPTSVAQNVHSGAQNRIGCVLVIPAGASGVRQKDDFGFEIQGRDVVKVHLRPAVPAAILAADRGNRGGSVEPADLRKDEDRIS